MDRPGDDQEATGTPGTYCPRCGASGGAGGGRCANCGAIAAPSGPYRAQGHQLEEDFARSPRRIVGSALAMLGLLVFLYFFGARLFG